MVVGKTVFLPNCVTMRKNIRTDHLLCWRQLNNFFLLFPNGTCIPSILCVSITTKGLICHFGPVAPHYLHITAFLVLPAYAFYVFVETNDMSGLCISFGFTVKLNYRDWRLFFFLKLEKNVMRLTWWIVGGFVFTLRLSTNSFFLGHLVYVWTDCLFRLFDEFPQICYQVDVCSPRNIMFIKLYFAYAFVYFECVKITAFMLVWPVLLLLKVVIV